MGTSGFTRGLYSFSVWATRFVSLNIMWMIMNIPIVYLILNVLAADTTNHLLTNLITIALMMPFILFPSTAAMFGIVRQWIVGNTDIRMIKSFWKYYKENYIKSLLGGGIITPLIVIMVIDYYYFSGANSPLFYMFLFIGTFIFVLIMHFFSNIVNVELKLTTIFRNSFLLAVGSPIYTIGIALSSMIIIYITFNFVNAFLILGMGPAIAYCSYNLYHMTHTKLAEGRP